MSDLSESEPTGAAAIRLPVRCDLTESEALFDRFCDLGDGDTLLIDASEVEQMSTPCVLAIVSSIIQRDGVTPPAAVISPSQPFIEAFQSLGLYREMMKMEFRT